MRGPSRGPGDGNGPVGLRESGRAALRPPHSRATLSWTQPRVRVPACVVMRPTRPDVARSPETGSMLPGVPPPPLDRRAAFVGGALLGVFAVVAIGLLALALVGRDAPSTAAPTGAIPALADGEPVPPLE